MEENMIKNALRVLLIASILIGTFFSIQNFCPNEVDAVVEETQLHEDWYGKIGDYTKYVYWCLGPGQGCYDVTAPNS
jgi:hypothetical protein